jgi:copper oxidase (laccase) domain-containing protein
MSTADVQVITPDWPAPPGVRSAFTLRTGGVSVAPYDSLNLGAGIGDSPEAIAENRRRVRETLGLLAEPAWLQQVHGVEVVDLGGATVASSAGSRGAGAHAAGMHGGGVHGAGPHGAEALSADPPIGDASIARGSGQVCAIRVADCMPVLFAARDGSAVAAAHAGLRVACWKRLSGGWVCRPRS